jgi:hypothetical protein
MGHGHEHEYVVEHAGVNGLLKLSGEFFQGVSTSSGLINISDSWDYIISSAASKSTCSDSKSNY